MVRRKQKVADESSSSPDPRRIQANVQLDTGRRRASRNGAIAFAVAVLLAAAAIVCALSHVVFGRIGAATIAEVATRRDQLDEELKEELEEKLSPWGIDVIDVEVRDIVVPKDLQASMAIESVAMRERNARLIMADAEADISEMLSDASEAYEDNADAMKLRQMHLAYESVKQSGGTLVLPSAFSEGFAPVQGGAGDRQPDGAKPIPPREPSAHRPV